MTGIDPREILPEVYDELRSVARLYLAGERTSHTLQPTALVHEAYMKVADRGAWRDATHFRAVAARAMRQILIDHARARGAVRRGGAWVRVGLDSAEPGAPESELDVVALDDALHELERLDERKSRIVELRFFGGLTCGEVAGHLDVSLRTVEADWYMARAWLRDRLSEDHP